MGNRKKKTTSILNDLLYHKYSQSFVSSKNDVSPSYVSRISKKLEQLKYEPKKFKDKIACLQCNSNEDLCIHHNHTNGRPIAILCMRCNKMVGDKSEFDGEELTNYEYSVEDNLYRESENMVTIRITKNLAKEIKELKITKLETYNEIINRLITNYKKEKKDYYTDY